jgi:peptidyl-prolyl cis-trans isomerase D
LKPGELSGIVTTEYGYHIVKVNEKENARVKPFDEVKGDLAAELKKQRITEQMQKTADGVHDGLAKAPGSAAEVAKKFGVDLVTVKDSAPGSPVPTLGSVPEIDSALAQTKVNEVTPVLTLPANRLVVAVLTDRAAPRPAIFEDVEAKVKDRLVSEKAIAVAKEKAKEAAAKLRAGEDIEKVAKEYKLEVNKPAEFGRSDSVEGLGQAAYVLEAFSSPVGSILGPTDIMNRDIVYKVTAKLEPDMAAFGAEKETIRQTIRQREANERWNLFMDSVTAKLTAEGKLKVNHELVDKLAAALKRS